MKINEIPIGTKIKAIIGYKPVKTKYHLFNSQGIQADDIGGWNEIVPEQKGTEVIGIVIEAPHPHGRKPNKLFKLLQWTDEEGKTHKQMLKNLHIVQILNL
jgi:primosomal protein N'